MADAGSQKAAGRKAERKRLLRRINHFLAKLLAASVPSPTSARASAALVAEVGGSQRERAPEGEMRSAGFLAAKVCVFRRQQIFVYFPIFCTAQANLRLKEATALVQAVLNAHGHKWTCGKTTSSRAAGVTGKGRKGGTGNSTEDVASALRHSRLKLAELSDFATIAAEVMQRALSFQHQQEEEEHKSEVELGRACLQQRSRRSQPQAKKLTEQLQQQRSNGAIL